MDRSVTQKALCAPSSNEMYKQCSSCGKEFQDFIEGVSYSSVAKGYVVFCSDKCCKDYLNSNIK